MELRDLQFRMFACGSKSDIVDFSKYSSDLFIKGLIEEDTILEICEDLVEQYHASSVRVWGHDAQEFTLFNDYEAKTHTWTNKCWITQREKRLFPIAVYSFNMLTTSEQIAICYDNMTNHTLIVAEGLEFDVGLPTKITEAVDGQDRVLYISGEWVWSTDQRALNNWINNWTLEVGEFCKNRKTL